MLRRTSATLLLESGATMQQIKQLRRWRSDLIAQGYIENSLRNKEMIYNRLIHETSKHEKNSPGFIFNKNLEPISNNELKVLQIIITNFLKIHQIIQDLQRVQEQV